MTIPFPGWARPQGWCCPTCGAVYAPWVYACTRCPAPVTTTTTTTTTTCDHVFGLVDGLRRCGKCGAPNPWGAP